MDIVYNVKSKNIITYYKTSGELNSTGNGSMSNKLVLKEMMKQGINISEVAIWSWITESQSNKLPDDFFYNCKQYKIILDEYNSPYAVLNPKSNQIFKIKEDIKSINDIPVIWHGCFYDTISYSLINRRFAFGLQDRGFNIKACAMRSSRGHEISSEDYERLISMESSKMHIEEKDAIKIYCYIPISRTPPAKHSIAYTMMESHTVSPTLSSTLNSYYDECWYPCFLKHTSICLKDKILNIQDVHGGHMAFTHNSDFHRVERKMQKKYHGRLCTINTSIMDNHTICTEDHPFFNAIFHENGSVNTNHVKPANELKRGDWLYYPRDKRDRIAKGFSLSEFLTINLDESFNVSLSRRNIVLKKTKNIWNHMQCKNLPYTYTIEGSGKVLDYISLEDNFFYFLGLISKIKYPLSWNYKSDKKPSPYYDKCEEYKIYTSLNKKEIYDKISTLIKEIFNTNTAVKMDDDKYWFLSLKGNEVMSIIISRLRLTDTFMSLFGQKEKSLFLKGFFEVSGFRDANRRGLISKDFDKDLNEIVIKFLLDLGIVPLILNDHNDTKLIISQNQKPNFFKIIGRDCEYKTDKKSTGWKVTEDKVFFRVKSVITSKEVEENVYNLEVCVDHSYVADFIAVHNCNQNIESFSKSGVIKPSYHMPLAIDHDKYKIGIEKTDRVSFEVMNPSPNRYPLKPSGFKFLSVFRYTYRKGPDVLIKAFRKAFRHTDDVSLIIYSRHYLGNISSANVDTIVAVRSDIQKWISGDDNAAPIYWSNDCLPSNEMPNLYGWGDCYVTTSRGEGFCLPPLEAASCGLPVIAPYHSGFMDYINDNFAYVIHPDGFQNCGHVEIKDGQQVYIGDNPEWGPWITNAYKDQMFPVFGDLSIEETAKHMRHIYDNYSEAKEKNDEFRKFIAQNYTWEKAIDRVAERINNIKKNNG